MPIIHGPARHFGSVRPALTRPFVHLVWLLVADRGHSRPRRCAPNLANTDRARTTADVGGQLSLGIRMRLVDKVRQSPVEEFFADDPDRRFGMRAAGHFRQLVEACPSRYILDRAASQQCADLVRRENLIAMPGDLLTLPPMERCWFEFSEEGIEEGVGLRIGAIAEFDADRQNGTLLPFGERVDGTAAFLHCTIAFDWGREAVGMGAQSRGIRLRHAEIDHVDALLSLVRVEPCEQWLSRCKFRGHSRQTAVRSLCENVWAVFPMFVAFCAMLNSRHVLNERPSDLTRLNAKRQKLGRTVLLDHVEIGLNLAARAARASEGPSTGQDQRLPPRLHLVRGHTVHRNGRSFWRSSHLRGEGERVLHRTVSVTSAS
jgi:hypothetical protein